MLRSGYAVVYVTTSANAFGALRVKGVGGGVDQGNVCGSDVLYENEVSPSRRAAAWLWNCMILAVQSSKRDEKVAIKLCVMEYFRSATGVLPAIGSKTAAVRETRSDKS